MSISTAQFQVGNVKTINNTLLYIILCIHWDTKDKKYTCKGTSGFTTDSWYAKNEAESKSLGKNQNGYLFNPSGNTFF